MKLPRHWSPRRASSVAIATALLAFASLAGCQTKDSLILVTASAADGYTTGLRSLVVTCGKTTQVFHIATGISTASVTVGLYVPSDTTGSQTVTAEAVGTQCGAGYSGNSRVNVASAGATVSTTITMLAAANVCPPTSGGTGGSGGNSACVSAAQPPVGTPPQFNCCIEYAQQSPETCSSSSFSAEIDAVAFSPDGKTFVSAEGNTGNNVKVWSFDGHTLTPKTVLASDGWWSLAYSADGSLLAVAVTLGVDLWNTSTWTLKTTLLGSSNFFKGVAFTPDQTHVIAIDEDGGGTFGTLYLFDLNAATSQVPIKTLMLSGAPEGLAVAAKAVNGQVGVAVSYSNGTADVFSYTGSGTFSTPTNVVVDSTGFDAWLPAFSPDGTLLAIGDDDGFIHFWNFPLVGAAESGTEIAFGTAGNADAVYAVNFSPNGSYLAAGGGSSGGDSNASVFNVATRSLRARANSTYDVTAIAFSPFGNAVGGGEADCGRVFMCTN